MADVDAASAPTLLQQLRAEGFEVCVEGDRLRIRPAERITPALRDALIRQKPALLAALQPVTEFVYLRGGLTVPVPALRLALDLEARGFRQSLTGESDYCIEPTDALTDADRAAIARWRLHLAAIVAYEAPTCA